MGFTISGRGLSSGSGFGVYRASVFVAESGGVGYRVLGLRCQGFRIRILGFGFWALSLHGIRVGVFWFGASGFGFRAEGLVHIFGVVVLSSGSCFGALRTRGFVPLSPRRLLGAHFQWQNHETT